ncbi:3-oxo-5-alpha-steroid 4-dehydrogenase 1 [Angomonas deanei]|nr:3-oxo-5-alpha-steroid 4-dehydrogenase 1 [Angomonas deanei]|eukprot:EPY40555.1 3-oxo-5-alpha-steroid 4-dehydrogenase 1 [Angomonas deanei]
MTSKRLHTLPVLIVYAIGISLSLFYFAERLVPIYFYLGPNNNNHRNRVVSSATEANEKNTAVLTNLCYIHFLLSIITFGLTYFVITAPFGRHAESSKGGSVHSWLTKWTMSAPLSWCLQEVPTLLQVLYFIGYEYPTAFRAVGDTNFSYGQLIGKGISENLHIGLLLFVFHYLHRSLIYPYYIATYRGHQPHDVPLPVTLSATAYCLFNGRLQLLANFRYYTLRATDTSAAVGFPERVDSFSFLRDYILHENSIKYTGSAIVLWFVSFLCYSVLFFYGMRTNLASDYYLLSLRDTTDKNKNSKSKYKIPMAKLFKYVSCPNFCAEFLEWFSYAMVVLATTTRIQKEDGDRYFIFFLQGLAALSFFVYTLANLIPRAREHHRFYLRHFGETYERLQRKAVIPFVY